MSPPPTLEEEPTKMTRNKTQASSLEAVYEGSDKLTFQRSQKAVDKDFIRTRSFRNFKNTVRLL